MKTKEEVLSTQKNWAEKQNIPIDEQGYVTHRDDNFFVSTRPTTSFG